MYEKDILPWIILLNYVITFIMCFIGTILSFLLIINGFRYKNIIKFSSTVNLYFFCVLIVGLITICNTSYLICFWRLNETIYNSKILYTLGAAAAQFLAAIPVIEFFTGVDRCLCILYPINGTSKLSYVTSFLSIVIIAIILVSYNYTNNIFDNFPTELQTSCRTFGCQKTDKGNLNTAIMKSSIAVFNIFIATLLGYLVKTRIFASLTIKRINNVVLRMSIATIILDFFPNLAAMIGLFLGSKLLNIFGPYSATLTSTNIAITTIMYWKTLQRSVKEKSKTSIQYFKSNIQN